MYCRPVPKAVCGVIAASLLSSLLTVGCHYRGSASSPRGDRGSGGEKNSGEDRIARDIRRRYLELKGFVEGKKGTIPEPDKSDVSWLETTHYLAFQIGNYVVLSYPQRWDKSPSGIVMYSGRFPSQEDLLESFSWRFYAEEGRYENAGGLVLSNPDDGGRMRFLGFGLGDERTRIIARFSRYLDTVWPRSSDQWRLRYEVATMLRGASGGMIGDWHFSVHFLGESTAYMSFGRRGHRHLAEMDIVGEPIRIVSQGILTKQ